MEKLTVVITTYNLEKYIEQAILSVLKQKVNFSVKILVADDASTDGTVSILQKYKRIYPNQIEIMQSNVNMGSLKNSNRAFSRVKSEYLLFLDGDDFFIDDQMLQRAVDFLDTNREFVLYGGNTVMMREEKYAEHLIDNSRTNQAYDFKDYLQSKVPFVHTSSIVLRNVVFSDGVPEVFVRAENTFENCALRGEDFRFLLHLEKGKIFVSSETVSCYRIHKDGLWQGASGLKRKIETAIAYNFQDKYWGNISSDFFHQRFINAYRKLMKFLIEMRNIEQTYNVTKDESELLIAFLKDISEREIDWGEDTGHKNENIIKRGKRFIKKMLKRICNG